MLKFIALCNPGVAKSTPRRNSTGLSRPRDVVLIVIWGEEIGVTGRLVRRRIRNVIFGFTDLSLGQEREMPTSGASSFSV